MNVQVSQPDDRFYLIKKSIICTMKQIVIADNQDLTYSGWLYLLKSINSDHQVIRVRNKKELLHMLHQQLIDIVIIDYTMFDFEQVKELIILEEKYKTTQWLIAADDLSDEFMRQVLMGTIKISILTKHDNETEMLTTLRSIFTGNRYISSPIANMLISNFKKTEKNSPSSVLTITEVEILKDIANGKTTKEIAGKRHVSTHTVMTHRKNIFRKIEVNNIHEATKYAIRHGIVDMTEYYI